MSYSINFRLDVPAGAYYPIAPFFGTLLAVILGDAVTWPLLLAGISWRSELDPSRHSSSD